MEVGGSVPYRKGHDRALCAAMGHRAGHPHCPAAEGRGLPKLSTLAGMCQLEQTQGRAALHFEK